VAAVDVTSLQAILQSTLGTSASTTLQERLRQCIAGLESDLGGADECLRRVRIAVKMFVDEKLADSLVARLRQEIERLRKP